MQLSLSRLNHRLPWGQAQPEVVQGTTEFHDQIMDPVFPQPDPVFDDAAALHTAMHMLDPQPAVVQGLVGQLLLQGEFLAAEFLGLAAAAVRKPTVSLVVPLHRCTTKCR